MIRDLAFEPCMQASKVLSQVYFHVIFRPYIAISDFSIPQKGAPVKAFSKIRHYVQKLPACAVERFVLTCFAGG